MKWRGRPEEILQRIDVGLCLESPLFLSFYKDIFPKTKDVQKVVRLHYMIRISCFVQAFQKDLHLVSAFYSEPHLVLGILSTLYLYKMPAWWVPIHSKDDMYIYIYIWWPPPKKKKTYVFNKNSGIYSVSRTFLPVDLGSFFWGGHISKSYIENTKHVKKRLSKYNYPVAPVLFCHKTEKLKNWIHMENLFLDLSGKFSF